ncbi:hypothetical protein [Nostoc sp. CALU 1950]|uniref:hypothetical protein n=1 Tax=Nostoc sp. CALU 1950 TaxID=3104321 RepID=UPI003EBA4C87
MTKSDFFQRLASVGLASTISTLTIIWTILTPGIESTVQAATYIEESGDGNLIPGDGPVNIPTFHKIEGILNNGGDIDLYQLQLDLDANVTVESFVVQQLISTSPIFPSTATLESSGLQPIFSFPDVSGTATLTPSLNFFLFDKNGKGLGTGFSKLSFSGVKDEIFYLGINGSVALNTSGDPILDPSVPDFIGTGSLTSWQDPGLATQAIINYQVSLTATSVPETSSTLSFLALATLGAASTLKRKLKPSKK